MTAPLRHDAPERRLFLALLGDAVARLAGGNPEGVAPAVLVAQRAETCEWLARDDEGPGISFVDLCAGLGLEPSAVRRALTTRPQSPRRRGRGGTRLRIAGWMSPYGPYPRRRGVR